MGDTAVLDEIPVETKASAIAGLGVFGFMILRWVGLRISKDAITYKADAADRDAFSRLQKRVEAMDNRVAQLESIRNRLFGFAAKCMAHVATCDCFGEHPPSKEDLHRDYDTLLNTLSGVSEGPDRPSGQ